MSEYNVELQDGIVVGGGGSDSVWLPNVSEQGVISWTKSTSTTEPTERNIKGADGADGEDGVGIASVSVNASNHLIVTKTDGTTQDAGAIDVSVPIDDTTAAANKVYSSQKVESITKFSPSYKGKNVVHMGDSWVELYNIAELAAQKVGYTVINVGMQATAIASVYLTPYSSAEEAAKLSLIALAQAIQSGTWTEQDAAASGKSWAGQLAKLKAIDWSTVDVLILSYGINDFNFQSTPGDVEARDSESVCGALKTAIGILGDLNSDMEIVITTPCLRYMSPDSENITKYAGAFYTQDDYRNAIGLVAKEYGIKLVDMRAISGINESNFDVTLLSDKLHPSELGQQLWTNAFAKSLECGFAGAFDTSLYNLDKEDGNLCEDNERYAHHLRWNASFVSNKTKYLCTSGNQQFRNMVLGQAYFASLPIGSVLKMAGYGKKIESQNHRVDIYVYDSTRTNKLLEKTSTAIKYTEDTAFEYSWTTDTAYTDCWVIFAVKNMSTWANGKALVRDVKCTVTIPST